MQNFYKLFSKIAIFVMIALPISASYSEPLEVVTENWRPYNYEEAGVVKGVSTQIVKKILDNSDINYTINVYPWARSYKMALEKENILIYTIIRIPQREKLFKWVCPLGKGGTTSLYRLKSQKNVHIETIADAKKYYIITNLNSMDHIWLKENGFTKLQIPSAVENALKMIFGKRAPLIAFDSTVMQKECQNAGYDPGDLVKVIQLFKTPPYMALSKQTSDKIFQQLKNSYDQLNKSHKINLEYSNN